MINWNEWFYYDETSPSCLRWKSARFSGNNFNRKMVDSGDIAGSMHNSGYYYTRIDGKSYSNHLIIWELFGKKVESEHVIDHLDGVRTNNKILNLRSVPYVLNYRNKIKGSANSTGMTGVHINDDKKGNYYYVATWRSLVGGTVY